MKAVVIGSLLALFQRSWDAPKRRQLMMVAWLFRLMALKFTPMHNPM